MPRDIPAGGVVSGAPSPARVEAAGALRAFNHLLVSHDLPEELLAEVAATAQAWGDAARAAPRRYRSADAMVQDLAGPRPGEGEVIAHFADCPFSGTANPLSFEMEARREGDQAVISVTLGTGHEGAPGRSHGGVVAGLFDDAFGLLTGVSGLTAYAGVLTVRFLRPTPVGEPMELRCWFGDRIGRRQRVHGELRHRGVLVVEGESVLVAVDVEGLGRATYAYGEAGTDVAEGAQG